MDDQELLEELKRAIARQRKWSNFFWWYDRSDVGKSIAECRAVADLLKSLALVGEVEYSHPRPSGDRWPDCVVDNSSGHVVAVEVTELVDSETLKGKHPPQPWSHEKLIQEIYARLRDKDAKAFHGEAYAEAIVLIHTDEFYLTPPETIRALRNASFRLRHGNLDRAFLLFSYWPALQCCPVAELTLTRDATSSE